jgi:glycosyltransferase, family 1
MKCADSLGVKALRSDRNEVSFIGMPDFRGAAGIIKHYFQIQKALSLALKEADCVIFRAPSPISMVSYGIVRRSGKPFAVELMNNPFTHFSPGSMHHFYQPIIQKFITNQTKRMCKAANGVSYVTDHVLQELYPSTARLNNKETEKYFESSYSTINIKKEDYLKREWPNQRPTEVVLVHSGEMLDYRKGQDVFINAIAELKEKGYPVRGILIGDGLMRQEFEKMAKELGVSNAIEFTGWKSGFKQVQAELLRGHFFVFPSSGEGLPRSVIEAMASGLLCFGSKIDGVVELLNEKMLVENMDGHAFAQHIEPFLDDWSMACAERNIQFEKSKEYEASILNKRRSEFYKKLRNLVDTQK